MRTCFKYIRFRNSFLQVTITGTLVSFKNVFLDAFLFSLHEFTSVTGLPWVPIILELHDVPCTDDSI